MDSTQDTLEHITKVQARMAELIYALQGRSEAHDSSKLEAPEKRGYDLLKELIAGVTYGTPEYAVVMQDPRIKDAIQHHVTTNSHHPQAHEDGVDGMTLIDVIELFCDWKAASERGGGVSFLDGIQFNRERGVIAGQLVSIFINTAEALGW